MRNPSPRRLRLLGKGFVAAIAVVTVSIFSGVFRAPFQPGAHEVKVDVEHAAQLHKGDQVRLEGNIDGKVTKIEPAPTPEAARVTLAVNNDAGPIYADARVRLRMKTLLGSAFYVDLERGTPGAGPLGNRVIGRDRTSIQTEIEDITDIFRADAVTGMQTLPRELATALLDPHPPVQALRRADAVATDAGVAVSALRGREPGGDLPRLVHSTAKAVRALQTPTDDIRALVAGAGATLQVTARRAAELQQIVRSGPGVTYGLSQTLARLDGTLDNTRGLIRRLDRGAPLIAPTLDELRPTLRLTASTLKNAKPLLRELGRSAATAGQFGARLTPVLDQAQPSLERTADTILPYFARKDPITGFSTTVMTGGFAAGFGGLASQQDQNGHYMRLAATFGASSVYLPCASTLIDPDAKSQLACDTLNTAFKTFLSYLPPGLTGGGARKEGKAK